jgi:hypothetical protein
MIAIQLVTAHSRWSAYWKRVDYDAKAAGNVIYIVGEKMW